MREHTDISKHSGRSKETGDSTPPSAPTSETWSGSTRRVALGLESTLRVGAQREGRPAVCAYSAGVALTTGGPVQAGTPKAPGPPWTTLQKHLLLEAEQNPKLKVANQGRDLAQGQPPAGLCGQSPRTVSLERGVHTPGSCTAPSWAQLAHLMSEADALRFFHPRTTTLGT